MENHRLLRTGREAQSDDRKSISALTLATHDMPRAVRFYVALGFDLIYGGADARFTSFRAGSGYLNLTAQPECHSQSPGGERLPSSTRAMFDPLCRSFFSRQDRGSRCFEPSS